MVTCRIAKVYERLLDAPCEEKNESLLGYVRDEIRVASGVEMIYQRRRICTLNWHGAHVFRVCISPGRKKLCCGVFWNSGGAAVLHRGPEVGNVIHVVSVGSFRKRHQTASAHLTVPLYMHIESCIIYLIAIDTFKVGQARALVLAQHKRCLLF